MTLSNELIATEVMEWWVSKYVKGLIQDTRNEVDYFEGELPDFRNDWNAAKLVIEKMREKGWRIVMDNDHIQEKWDVDLFGNGGIIHNCIHESLPTAVAMAACKALGVEVTV